MDGTCAPTARNVIQKDLLRTRSLTQAIDTVVSQAILTGNRQNPLSRNANAYIVQQIIRFVNPRLQHAAVEAAMAQEPAMTRITILDRVWVAKNLLPCVATSTHSGGSARMRGYVRHLTSMLPEANVRAAAIVAALRTQKAYGTQVNRWSPLSLQPRFSLKYPTSAKR